MESNTTTRPVREQPGRPVLRRILVATDFSEHAEHALSWALATAGLVGAEVRLIHVLHPLESDTWSPLYYLPDASARSGPIDLVVRDLMRSACTRHNPAGVRFETGIRRGANVAPEIVADAQAYAADLVVLGTHGRRGVQRVLMGSVAEAVVHTAHCPVLLVRGRPARPEGVSVRRILVPVDLSESTEQVVSWASVLAVAFDADVLLLHVLEAFPPSGLFGEFDAAVSGQEGEDQTLARQALRALVADFTLAGVKSESFVERAAPAPFIPDFAASHGVDLIVMASHARTGFRRLALGSVAEKVVRRAHCPVLVVRMQTEEASPLSEDQASGEWESNPRGAGSSIPG